MDDIDWTSIGEKAAYAVVILVVTWILAAVIKWALSKLVGKIPALQHYDGQGQPPGQSIGSIGSLLVWLFGLVAILQVFALDSALRPVQGSLSTVMNYLPNLIGAGVVFFIGLVMAKIAKQIVETSVSMINFSGLAERAKNVPAASQTPGGHADEPSASPIDSRQIGAMVGNLVFAVIVIVLSIAALQILDISVISNPAEEMLTMILSSIPWIVAAAIILGIGVLISKLVGSVLETTLRGLGTDRAISGMGITRPGQSASTIITRIAQVAVMVFFGIMAARALDFPEITHILNEVLALGGHVVFGGVIIAAGFIVAQIVANAAGEGTTSTIVRVATIMLFVAMGLKYMGIADSIITLGFGAIVVGAALAAALAFGLGGRDAASRTLAQIETKRKI